MQDVIIEPIRSILIPGFYQVKEDALTAGALGVGISGSGPSIFALSNSEDKAKNISVAMASAFSKMGIGNEVYVSKINTHGVNILD
jgi:homoserine kinase